MEKSILEKYASLLTYYCLDIQPQEKVLVRASYLAEPLLQILYPVLLEAGAHVEFQLSFNHQDRLFYEQANDNQLNQISSFYEYGVENFDVMLNIRSPFDLHSLKQVDSEKKVAHQKAYAAIKKTFMKRSSSGDLKWCLCVYPTQTAAEECSMSLEEYTEFVYQACFLDQEDPVSAWKQVSLRQQKMVDELNKKSDFHIVGDQTDLRFSTQSRIWMNSDGKRNMPSGEVFSSPVEDSVNGQIFFSVPTVYHGVDVQGVLLMVENGYIISWKAQKGQKVLDEAFLIPGARYFGEVAIGTNDHIQKSTKNILFDEKMGGTIHMAVGASYPETGGKNESALHWDMIKEMRDGGQIFADGDLIYENGQFLM